MVENKRDRIKHVRDKAKAAYQKQPNCYICNCTESLELHHYSSLTQLLDLWAQQKGYVLATDEQVLNIRDEFIKEHYKQLYEQVVTLCKKHHQALHKLYGGKPLLSTATKQQRWVEKQKEKYGIKKLDT